MPSRSPAKYPMTLPGPRDSRTRPDAALFAKLMLKETAHMFWCRHAFLEGTITRRQLQDTTVLIRARMKRCCLKYQDSADDQVRTRARSTLKNRPHLFAFMFHEGVLPTNHPAESALRPAV